MFIPRHLILCPLLLASAIAEPTAPPAPSGRVQSPAFLATATADIAFTQCQMLIRLEVHKMRRSDPRHRGEKPTPEQLKSETELYATATKRIEESRIKLEDFANDPKAKPVAAPALELIAVTRKLSTAQQEIITVMSSGKAPDSPEVKALAAKAETLNKTFQQSSGQLITVVTRVRAEDKASTEKSSP